MSAAALACAWISLTGWAFAAVAAGIAIAWAWHAALALRRGRSALRALELSADGSARCQDGLGEWHKAEMLPGSYVSSWLTVLTLRPGSRSRRSLILLPDAADADELRRLRVWLRWRLGQR